MLKQTPRSRCTGCGVSFELPNKQNSSLRQIKLHLNYEKEKYKINKKRSKNRYKINSI